MRGGVFNNLKSISLNSAIMKLISLFSCILCIKSYIIVLMLSGLRRGGRENRTLQDEKLINDVPAVGAGELYFSEGEQW